MRRKSYVYIIRRIICQSQEYVFEDVAYCTDERYAKDKVIVDLKREYLEEHPYMKYDPVQDLIYGVHPIHGYYTVKWDIVIKTLINEHL